MAGTKKRQFGYCRNHKYFFTGNKSKTRYIFIETKKIFKAFLMFKNQFYT